MNPVFLLSPPLSNLVPLYQKLPPFWSPDHSLPLRSYAKKNVYPPSIIWKSATSPLFNFNFKRRMILGSRLHPYIRYQRDAGTCGFSSVLDLSLPKVSRLRDVQWKQMEIMTTTDRETSHQTEPYGVKMSCRRGFVNCFKSTLVACEMHHWNP